VPLALGSVGSTSNSARSRFCAMNQTRAFSRTASPSKARRRSNPGWSRLRRKTPSCPAKSTCTRSGFEENGIKNHLLRAAILATDRENWGDVIQPLSPPVWVVGRFRPEEIRGAGGESPHL